MATGSLMSALNPMRSKTSMPEQLLLPTYQNQLRIIGRHLDTNGYRSISLLDVEGGILVRAFTSRRHESELLEFPDTAFGDTIREAIQGRSHRKSVSRKTALIPTGYEDLLRAIGYEIDQRIGKAIALHEANGFIFIAGLSASEKSNGSFSPFEMMLTPEDVRSILDSAFRRRGR